MALQDDQQMSADLRPHGGDAGEQGKIVLEVGMSIDVVVDVLLQLGEFLVQEGKGVLDGFEDTFRCGRGQGFFLAVVFAAQILDECFTTGQQSLQGANFQARRLPGHKL